jgi:hypothetical protein
MTLINQLLQNAPTMEERTSLRVEMQAAGLAESIDVRLC